MSASTKPIFIVYHVAIMRNWETIVKEQMEILNVSGLGQESTRIYVQLTGVKDSAHFMSIKKHFEHLPFYSKMNFRSFKKLEVYENPSIRQVQVTARTKPNAKIFYFHTNGVYQGEKNVGTNYFHKGYWTPEQLGNIQQWRRFMEFFTITKWKDCIKYLETYDCCGTDWVKNRNGVSFHFSGNFWWANADYILRCTLEENNRFNCERFIGTGSPRAKELISSIKNPKLKKYFPDSKIKEMGYTLGLDSNYAIFQWWNYYYEEKYYNENIVQEKSLPISPPPPPVPLYIPIDLAESLQVVYHIATIGNWQEIVREQLNLLSNSGLGSATKYIYVNVVGMDENQFSHIKSTLFANYPFFNKMRFEFHGSLQEYEFPSIRKVQEVARNYPNAKILYFHTKGASHGVKETVNASWNKNQIKNAAQWRRFMEYHAITKWRDAVQALNEFEACGTDWGRASLDKPFHFSGNFWWATAKYINRCSLATNDRFDCETFIGTGQPKVKMLMSSIDNPKLKTYFSDIEIERMRIRFSAGLTFFQWYDYYYDDKYFRN